MASLISCPHCGIRPKEEYAIKGATLPRPAADAPQSVWFDHVFLRENPRGLYEEYWHHAAGCRRWLIVTRDTASHEVVSCRDVAEKQAVTA